MALPIVEQAWHWPRGWRLWVALAGPVAALGGAWAMSSLLEPALDPAALLTLAVLLLAALFWATEPIPAVATSLVVMGLLTVLVGLPGTLGADWARDVGGWERFIAPAASPLMLLMLGSLVLSAGAQRTGLDRVLGAVLLRQFSGSPRRLVIGVMLVSALLSMWTSNTATAAIMLAVTRPVWSRGDLARSTRAGVVLAAALGANAGGIATPIGTPPNTIVFMLLQRHGQGLDFVRWLLVGLPVSACVLCASAAVLLALVRPGKDPVPLDLAPAEVVGEPPPRWARPAAGGLFALTATLWLTSPWTGIPVAAAALLPVVLFPALGILRPSDLNRLEWDVLLLILGGLVLGGAMEWTGLAQRLVQALPIEALPTLGVVAGVAAVAVVLSSFMSNTAVANLLCPVGLGVASAMPPGAMQAVGLAIAFASGSAMVFPVSTPPNALAYRTGLFGVGTLMAVGSAAGVTGVAAVVVLAELLFV